MILLSQYYVCHSETIDSDLGTFKNNKLLSNPVDVQTLVGHIASFDVYLTNAPTEPVLVSFRCESTPCSTFDHNISQVQLTSEKYRTEINITVVRPGHDVIIFDFNKTNIYDKLAFTRVRVGRSQCWTILSLFFGWGYFFIWSLSFWPQNVINYRRKSVVGLSHDYAILHFTGFLYYSIFNVALYYSPLIRDQYENKFPRSEIPVELNDVVYALHAAFTTSITWIQCFVYERGDQRLALYSKLFQTIVWTIGGILMVLVFLDVITWLEFIYYFSYVKLLVTSIKYLPQIWFNFKRKSTIGWTIYMVYLDVTGGLFSMLQMLTIAYNYNDWRTLIGNLPKFGLGLASVFYDLIFLLQHFVLYRHPLPSSEHLKKRSTIKSIYSLHNNLCNINSATILINKDECQKSTTNNKNQDVH